MELSKQEITGLIPSVQKFFREELEHELSEMKTRQLLDYIIKEIGPYAYNRGVKDAESFFRRHVEDLTATCFEEGLTYWVRKRK